MSPDWGLTTSFAWLNGSQRYSDESSNGRVTTRYYSLLAGPSWKINNQLSLYSQVGPVLLHQRDHGINESDSKVGYGYSAGVAYTPVSSVAITLGYEERILMLPITAEALIAMVLILAWVTGSE